MTSSPKKLSVVMANFNATSDDSLTMCPRQLVIPAVASLHMCRIDQLMKVSYSVTDFHKLFC